MAGVAQHARLVRTMVEALEGADLGRPQQRNMRDLAQVIGNKPDTFFAGHPVARIEAREVDGAGEAAQGAAAAQAEIIVEIADGQLTQIAVQRLPVAESDKVGFGHRTPAGAYAEERDDVVGIAIRL